jgi:hypothetical protein
MFFCRCRLLEFASGLAFPLSSIAHCMMTKHPASPPGTLRGTNVPRCSRDDLGPRHWRLLGPHGVPVPGVACDSRARDEVAFRKHCMHIRCTRVGRTFRGPFSLSRRVVTPLSAQCSLFWSQFFFPSQQALALVRHISSWN